MAVHHRWVPVVAAAAGAALTLKAALIIASGNGVPDTPMAVLYLLGLLLGVAAAVGAGMRRGGWVGAAVGAALSVLLVLWIMGLGDAIKPAVGVVSDAEHVLAEVPIGIAGVVLLGAAYAGYRRDTSGATDAAPVSAPRGA